MSNGGKLKRSELSGCRACHYTRHSQLSEMRKSGCARNKALSTREFNQQRTLLCARTHPRARAWILAHAPTRSAREAACACGRERVRERTTKRKSGREAQSAP
eukprot:1645154-Pleurochrysis_carterae.AAC.2